MNKNVLYPINKSIEFKIHPNIYKNIKIKNNGISIITCTNKKGLIKNIFNNYHRQHYEKKELIIILNNNNLNIQAWENESKKYENVKIYQLDENISLGECLNYAIKKSKYPIIAKFDDDDYYGPFYLSDSLKAFEFTKADLIGKSTTFTFFEEEKILTLKNINKDNRYVYRVEGATLIFKKNILNKVKFKPKNLGEDVQFCKDCIKNNFKIYSTNKFHYLCLRKPHFKHTWNMKNKDILKRCKIIRKNIDYKTILDSFVNVTSPK